MAENENMFVKESLNDQYAVMQKLYVELEQEREASATAATEALSMILRLQVEKAAEKMEACQYKRIAEEKIHHSDESLAILEELLFQREMEIASLRFEVQTYRDTLLKSGTISCTMGGMNVLKAPLDKADAFLGNLSFHGNVGRSFSLPVMRYKKMCSEMDIVDEEVFSPPAGQQIPEFFSDLTKNMKDKEGAGSQCTMLPDLSEESPFLNCNFHCDPVADEHKNMEETSDVGRINQNLKSDYFSEHIERLEPMPIASINSENECISSSWCSVVSGNTFYDSMIDVAEAKLSIEDASYSCFESEDKENLKDFDSHRSSYMESELARNTILFSSVHDIFEVPHSESDYRDKLQNKFFTDPAPEKEDVPSTLYSMPEDVKGYYLKDDERLTKALQDGQCGTILYVPRKEFDPNCNWATKNPKTGISLQQRAEDLWQADVKHLEKRLQVLEDYRKSMKQEDSDRTEQIKLLKEISEQLGMIHSLVKKPPAKKYPNKDDISVVSVTEAMLSFSI